MYHGPLRVGFGLVVWCWFLLLAVWLRMQSMQAMIMTVSDVKVKDIKKDAHQL